MKAKFIEAISDNRIPFLKDGTADLILSTMTINAERDEEIDFSEPYFIARGRILVKKSNTDITGVKDLAGKEVCTVLGSTYEDTLKKQAPKAKRRLVDTYSECLELIQNGAVEAESTDDVILTGHDHPGRHAQARRRAADDRALRRRHQGRRYGVQDVRQRVDPEVQGGRSLGDDPTRSGSASTPARSRSRRR